MTFTLDPRHEFPPSRYGRAIYEAVADPDGGNLAVEAVGFAGMALVEPVGSVVESDHAPALALRPSSARPTPLSPTPALAPASALDADALWDLLIAADTIVQVETAWRADNAAEAIRLCHGAGASVTPTVLRTMLGPIYHGTAEVPP